MLRSLDDWEEVCTLEGHRGWQRLKKHLAEELDAARNKLEIDELTENKTNHLRGQIFMLRQVIGVIEEGRKAIYRMNQGKQTPAESQVHRHGAAPGL